MSSTRSTRRNPLTTLPLHQFATSSSSSSTSTSFLAPPSPLSMSNKRSAPSSTSGSPSSRAEGSRKVSRGEGSDSVRSGRRGSVEITPKMKERLERDDLGIGKSPARRLFVGVESPIIRSGISGISTIPPQNHASSSSSSSIFPQPESHNQHSLAPSPPISPRTRSSTSTSTSTSTHSTPSKVLPGPVNEDVNGVQRSIHDPGFPIHPDNPFLILSSGLNTPDSKRTTHPLPLPSTSSSTPNSPSSVTGSKYENQENIPPVTRSRSASTHSNLSSPASKGSSNIKGVMDSGSSTGSKSGSSVYEEEDTVMPVLESREEGGGGKRRLIGRGGGGKSKLIQVMLRATSNPVDVVEPDTEPESDGEEELTPGKLRTVDPKGKEKLFGEVEN